MAAITLSRAAARALLAEARREFDNAAQERWGGLWPDEAREDHSQVPALEASVELIGKLGRTTERSWPQEDSPIGPYDRTHVTFELSVATIEWLRRLADDQEGYVRDLENGEDTGEPGYIESQVYLLHVLRGIERQLEAVC
jgi:hypothetical protein